MYMYTVVQYSSCMCEWAFDHHISTYTGGSCVYVHGKDANPVLSHCTVSNANNVGIFVDDHARVRAIMCHNYVMLQRDLPIVDTLDL